MSGTNTPRGNPDGISRREFLTLGAASALGVAATATRGWALPARETAMTAATTNSNAPAALPPGQRQLFLDDAAIASTEDLARTMHRPAKQGAVIRPNVDRGETCLQTRSAPAFDPEAGVYKLWMITSATHSGTTYAESEDGLHWRKPALRQREVNGSLENNFVTPNPAFEWPANAMENVVYDPDDPDSSRRFKGFAHCFDRQPIVSPDGRRWRFLDVPPIPSSDESNLSYDRQARTFIATVKHGGPHGRSVHLTTSTDFEHWTPHELMFHADDTDQAFGRARIAQRFADPYLSPPALNVPTTYNVDIYNMGVFRYEGLYVGLPSVFHRTGLVPGDWTGFDEWDIPPETLATFRQHGDWAGFHHVQLTCSRDLRTWQRLGDRQPFIDLSPIGSGAYDLATIIGPSYPVVRGNELWFYYTGIKQYGGPVPRTGMESGNGAICLAVLRRDGFVSLDAGEREGTVVTKPFVCSGEHLRVNFAATRGELGVAVLDEQGNALAESAPLSGDVPDGEVAWRTGSIAAARGRTVSLRFTLRRGSLYAYWLA